MNFTEILKANGIDDEVVETTDEAEQTAEQEVILK